MSNPKKPDALPPAGLPRGTTIRQGSGMGGNPDENLRVGQHRVSDHDADNHGRGGKDSGDSRKGR